MTDGAGLPLSPFAAQPAAGVARILFCQHDFEIRNLLSDVFGAVFFSRTCQIVVSVFVASLIRIEAGVLR